MASPGSVRRESTTRVDSKEQKGHAHPNSTSCCARFLPETQDIVERGRQLRPLSTFRLWLGAVDRAGHVAGVHRPVVGAERHDRRGEPAQERLDLLALRGSSTRPPVPCPGRRTARRRASCRARRSPSGRRGRAAAPAAWAARGRAWAWPRCRSGSRSSGSAWRPRSSPAAGSFRLSCASTVTYGLRLPLTKTSCHGWRRPPATTSMSLPFGFIETSDCANGEVVELVVELRVQRDARVEAPVRAEGEAVEAVEPSSTPCRSP